MTSKVKNWLGYGFVAAVLLGMPLVVIGAGLYGTDLYISNWGLFGYNSSNSGGLSVAVGSGNTWDYNVLNSLTIGTSLTAYDSNSMVVGQWNEDTDVTEDELFVVGIGTSTTPENALEILDDGTIRVPKVQGDVPLGQFGE